MLPSLLLPVLLLCAAQAQEPTSSIQTELADREAAEPVLLDQDGLPALTTSPGADRALRRAKDKAREQRQRTNQLLLGVCGLLLLWLLARGLFKGSGSDAAPQSGERPHRRRRVALSHEELGHLIFEVARNLDHVGFRDLFLNGPEAADLLGQVGAAAYLEERGDRHLRGALDGLARGINRDAVYVGVEPVSGGLLGLRIRRGDGTEQVLSVGTATEAGGGVRLHLPVVEVAQVSA